MSPQEMFNAAKQCGDEGIEHMVLVVPHCFARPAGFPRGELLSETEDRGKVYCFRSDRVLAWLRAHASELGLS